MWGFALISASYLVHLKKIFYEPQEAGKMSSAVIWHDDIVYLLTLSQTSSSFNVSAVQVFWKHCGKRRNCNEQFLLFPECFLPVWRTFCHLHQNQNCRLQTLSVWKSLKFVVCERVNSLANYKNFTQVQIQSSCRRQNKYDRKLKFVMEREENSVRKGENAGTSIFSFSHTVFKGFLPQGQ